MSQPIQVYAFFTVQYGVCSQITRREAQITIALFPTIITDLNGEQGITIRRDVSSRRLQFTYRLSFCSSLPFFSLSFRGFFLSPLCPIQQSLYLFPSLSDLETLHIICHSLKHLGKTLIHICRVMGDGGRPKMDEVMNDEISSISPTHSLMYHVR